MSKHHFIARVIALLVSGALALSSCDTLVFAKEKKHVPGCKCEECLDDWVIMSDEGWIRIDKDKDKDKGKDKKDRDKDEKRDREKQERFALPPPPPNQNGDWPPPPPPNGQFPPSSQSTPAWQSSTSVGANVQTTTFTVDFPPGVDQQVITVPGIGTVLVKRDGTFQVIGP